MLPRPSVVSTLHARLNLPSSFSHSTLQRCLVDKTVSPEVNNASLAVHGNHLLGYYITSHIMTRYPRLPFAVIKNALVSYAGWKTLASVGRGWGVEGITTKNLEMAALGQTSQDPKEEKETGSGTSQVSSALLQVSRVPKGQTKSRSTTKSSTMTTTIPAEGEPGSVQYLDRAYAEFVQAVVAGVAIHAGPTHVREFIQNHFLSRDLDLARTFRVLHPQREISTLCARENLERPVTRLIAETGRRTNSPIFIVGIFSGWDKLGEGQASSLKEAEHLAQSNAMKAWYLLEDKTATFGPLTLEGDVADFKPAMVDTGDIIV